MSEANTKLSRGALLTLLMVFCPIASTIMLFGFGEAFLGWMDSFAPLLLGPVLGLLLVFVLGVGGVSVFGERAARILVRVFLALNILLIFIGQVSMQLIRWFPELRGYLK